jgi:hypothetical protein
LIERRATGKILSIPDPKLKLIKKNTFSPNQQHWLHDLDCIVQFLKKEMQKHSRKPVIRLKRETIERMAFEKFYQCLLPQCVV